MTDEQPSIGEVMALLSTETASPSAFHVTKTDMISARYIQMPFTGTSVKFIVQMLEPIELGLQEKVIELKWGQQARKPVDQLEELLIKEWREMVIDLHKAIGTEPEPWMLLVDKVYLVECEMKPKLVTPGLCEGGV